MFPGSLPNPISFDQYYYCSSLCGGEHDTPPSDAEPGMSDHSDDANLATRYSSPFQTPHWTLIQLMSDWSSLSLRILASVTYSTLSVARSWWNAVWSVTLRMPHPDLHTDP